MSRILITLGGNALGNFWKEQKEALQEASRSISDLIEKGHEVIISHGNGPQVGMIHDAMAKEEMPLTECTAMSQGYIGYHLQNALKNEVPKRGIEREVLSVVTQVVVDEKDEAFKNPQKPIGRFMSLGEAKA